MSETQLDRWQGDFGREYTDRNQVDWRTRVEGFRQMIPPDTASVLEVGSNAGHNLLALEDAFSKHMRVFGTEPAAYARQKAREHDLLIYDYSIYDIRLTTQFDLVFTSGVLIHVPPDLLDVALRSVVRCAERYVLAVEYFGKDEAVEYRGHEDMLWRRDYGQHYLRVCPELKLIGAGVNVPGFEGATYWLLEK